MKDMPKYLKTALLVCAFFLLIIPDIGSGQTVKVTTVAGGESHSVALKEDGTVWAWGANGSGQVGGGDVGEDVLNPVQVIELTGYLTDITAIAAGTSYWLNQGGHSVALRNDGTVWAWGGGLEGQLGDGAGISRSIPVQVVDESDPTGFLTGVSGVSAGDYHSMAFKIDGTVWAWGANGDGQLGEGTKEDKFTAVQVSGLTNVISIAAAKYYSLALKDNGTVWSWGDNANGQLGDGSNFERLTPVPVVDITDVIAIAAGDYHSLALKNDGTVWAWGANSDGQLGDGTIGWYESKNTPVQVIDSTDSTGYLTEVIAIAAGDFYSIALKSDGTVWTWGRNWHGQLGDGTTEGKSTPVQVSGLTNVIFIDGGNAHILAIKGDGTVWSWGGNWSGQLGDGTTEQRTKPVQTIFLEQEEEASLLEIRGPHFITPGEEVTYMVHYENIMDETLEDVVILLDPPGDFTIISTTGDGMYRYDHHRVFWILGDVNPGEKGNLAVTMEVAWGLPAHSMRNFVADIGARNIPSNIDIDEYLNLSEIKIVSEKDFNEEEITALLTSDQELRDLFDHALQLGYNFDNVAQQFDYSDGSSFLQFTLIDPETFSPAFLLKADDEIYIEKYHEGTFSQFTRDGGYSEDVNDGSSTLWGTWAEGSDQSASESWRILTKKELITADTTNAPSSATTTHKQTRSYCTNVCIIKNVPEWWSYIKHNLKVTGDPKKARWCFACRFGLANNTWDPENCEKCARLFAQTLVRRIRAGVDIRVVSPPLYKHGGKVLKCVRECKNNPDTWQCSDNITRCDEDVRMEALVFDTIPIPEPVAMIRHCVEGKDGSSHYLGEKVLQWCTGGKCEVIDGIAQCVWCNNKKSPRKLYQVPISNNVISMATEVLTAHDSNEKHIDIPGDVIPGQTLNYTIDYEKENKGTAYELFVLDELDIDLDETTFVINKGGSYNVVCMTSESLSAHDPNAKHVDAPGDVIPGQALNYTIEYENEGEGTAYGVFIIDELDIDLDETTLVISNGGSYSDVSRLLSWDIGEVPPGGQGEVTFSVNVKGGLPSGTEITNFADIHFPSVPEITPTNPVVNIVKTIVADPQTISATAGTPISITLTGSDTGASTLTFEITSDSLYGTLTGIPPNVTYTSMDEFSGQDEFYFVVNNGMIDSDPARVAITVAPDPSDTNPPEVTETYPGEDATNVHVDGTPVSEDPEQYMPIITANFSEPIDSETVTTDSFTVDGLTGTVYYDEQLRTAYFIPSVALMVSTTYTARLSTGIKDKVGNPMASEYSWQFTTISPANIEVALPDNADEVNFGGVLIDSSSGERIVNVLSTGTVDLELGTMTLTGTDSGEFGISGDNCSSVTLAQFDNCTVKIVFEPVSAGVKSAYLSIPSNDTDEDTVEVTLSGIGIAESFWPTLYDEMWDIKKDGNLFILRTFRDDVLANSDVGRDYISIIYGNSPEIAVLLIQHPSLSQQTREVIDELLPGIRSLLADKRMSLSKEQLVDVELLIDEFESKAAPELRTVIRKVKKDINKGEMLKQLGIIISE